MQSAELRRRLGAILAAEETDAPDWVRVEGLSRKLSMRLAMERDSECPEVVRHFLSDADIRAKDSKYAENQREAVGRYVATGEYSGSRAVPRWIGFLLLPMLVPISVIAGLWPSSRTVDRSPEDVVRFLRGQLDETAVDTDWDDFESVPIRDAELEALRKKAVLAGPPDPDLDELRALLGDAEAIAQSRVRDRHG